LAVKATVPPLTAGLATTSAVSRAEIFAGEGSTALDTIVTVGTAPTTLITCASGALDDVRLPVSPR
jgi:hypothetical protein